MLNISKDDIGRGVTYKPEYGPMEEGVITSFNEVYAFVRYGKDKHSKATARSRLMWSVSRPLDVFES